MTGRYMKPHPHAIEIAQADLEHACGLLDHEPNDFILKLAVIGRYRDLQCVRRGVERARVAQAKAAGCAERRRLNRIARQLPPEPAPKTV